MIHLRSTVRHGFCIGPARIDAGTSIFIILIIGCSLVLSGCSVKSLDRRLVDPDKAARLDPDSEFLKAHMRDGRVYVLSDWSVDEENRIVNGSGKLLGINREFLEEGGFSFSLDSVAIFETNTLQTSPSVIGMAILTGTSVAITIFCIANPKACFGSCPTFYVSDGKEMVLQAEGFSSSVAPCLERYDIDALCRAKPNGKNFEITMKNEAQETHVVRYADLLLAPRPPNGRVYTAPDGSFWQTNDIIAPFTCQGSEGDCLFTLSELDSRERVSEADSFYLAAKETIDLTFEAVPGGRRGLIIGFRQSLLSTYLFYQALAYMGSAAAECFAKMESGNLLTFQKARELGGLLGGIEVFVRDDSGQWIPAGEIIETGPLAVNTVILPLPETTGTTEEIRLRMAKGNWRLDYIALAALGQQVKPVRITPEAVNGNSDRYPDPCLILRDSAQVLVTLPGDNYTLTYSLPDDYENYELFLISRGYYLEWIRDEWLAEENPLKAVMMFLNPEKTLRDLAPEFKLIETEMEKLFWGSKYAH
jgi:hypothetical protein